MYYWVNENSLEVTDEGCGCCSDTKTLTTVSDIENELVYLRGLVSKIEKLVNILKEEEVSGGEA